MSIQIVCLSAVFYVRFPSVSFEVYFIIQIISELSNMNKQQFTAIHKDKTNNKKPIGLVYPKSINNKICAGHKVMNLLTQPIRFGKIGKIGSFIENRV